MQVFRRAMWSDPRSGPTTERRALLPEGSSFTSYIKSLKQLVHFYNSADKRGLTFNVTSALPGRNDRKSKLLA